jgi:hypothetical protein
VSRPVEALALQIPIPHEAVTRRGIEQPFPRVPIQGARSGLSALLNGLAFFVHERVPSEVMAGHLVFRAPKRVNPGLFNSLQRLSEPGGFGAPVTFVAGPPFCRDGVRPVWIKNNCRVTPAGGGYDSVE